jgi:hypothetical protein
MNLLRIAHGKTQTASFVRFSVARHLQGQFRARERDKTESESAVCVSTDAAQ